MEKEIYHVYNRGTNKENLFRDKQDYRAFLYRLGLGLGIKSEILNKNEITRSSKSRIRITKSPFDFFKLHSFCLMPNHFHLLIEQTGDVSISSLIQKICTSFSMYINKKYGRVGHLFQGNFKSVLIESNPQFMWTTSYIHTNPVKGNLVIKPEEYDWSSYIDYAKNRNLPIIYKDFIVSVFGSKENLIKQTSIFKNKKFDVKVQP